MVILQTQKYNNNKKNFKELTRNESVVDKKNYEKTSIQTENAFFFGKVKQKNQRHMNKTRVEKNKHQDAIRHPSVRKLPF